MHVSLTPSAGGERGSALIVVITVLLLLGVLVGVGMVMFRVETPVDRALETQRRMEAVMDQIAAYAQRENRIPCPADPAVAPGTVGHGQEALSGATATSCSLTEGILPYLTIHQGRETAYDGWGRYYTYAISPVFADVQANPTDDIFYRCRLQDRWVKGGQALHPAKARFCCPGVAAYGTATDLVVEFAGAAIDPSPLLAGDTRSTSGGDYNDADTPIVAYPAAPARSATGWAVVLISHGGNGDGAFDATGAKLPFGGAGGLEQENADGDRTFADGYRIAPQGAQSYDDILLYRTQTQLMFEVGQASCSYPWR